MVRGASRFTALLAGLALGCGLSGQAVAAYPDHPVHFIVGAAPGGNLDALTRLVSTKLSEKWGQPVVVENRPGASNTIAADLVAHSAPDGYTFVMINNNHTGGTPPDLKLNYDPIKSFSAVNLIARSTNILVTNPTAIPANNIKELIAYAKTKPGQLNFGSSGTSSSTYLQMMLLMSRTGTNMVNVNYTGSGPASVALLGGEIQLMFASATAVLPHTKTGKMKALAVTTAQRSELLPDVPTLAEAAGLNGFDEGDWEGVLMPAGTPRDIVAKVHDDIAVATRDPEIEKSMLSQGLVPVNEPPDQFGAFLASDLKKWADLRKNFITK